MLKFFPHIERKVLIPFVAYLIVVAAAVGAYAYRFGYELKLPMTETAETWGQFGDYIGGVLNPLVGGLTLMWLIRTFHLQKTELSETRVALKASQLSQAEQARLTLVSTQLQAKSLKLAAINDELRYRREIRLVWMNYANSPDHNQVVGEEGDFIHLGNRLTHECELIEFLERRQFDLLQELDGLK